MLGQMLTSALSDDMFQAVISNSASCDDIALTPDGLDGDGNTRLGRKKGKEGN